MQQEWRNFGSPWVGSSKKSRAKFRRGRYCTNIHAYRSVAHAPERATIIRRYAEITHRSLGRAEDALDFLIHLLETARQVR